jgi:hypothetical protein
MSELELEQRGREFLASKQITVLEHPPYSLALTSNDFFLFPKIRDILKGRHFDDIDDIRSHHPSLTLCRYHLIIGHYQAGGAFGPHVQHMHAGCPDPR